jgi:hypothetical protein
MIVSYGAGPGRRVLLADANPAIGALAAATLAPLAGARDPAAGHGTVNPAVTARRPDPAPRAR